MKKLCFFMADIGFCINNTDRVPQIGEYLSVFQIAEEYFIELKEQIQIDLIDVDVAELRPLLLSAPYGHCHQAVYYFCEEWKKEKISVRVNPAVYRELGFTVNQILALAGIHSAFLWRDALVLHASYIIWKNKAIIFTAPSGIGKSTQASLWNFYQGAEIINGDRALIRKRENFWKSYGFSVCGSSAICKNKSADIGVIVVLEQGPENYVEKLSMGAAYQALYSASAYHTWNHEEMEKTHELILKILYEVKIVKLICRPDVDAVNVLKNYMENEEII